MAIDRHKIIATAQKYIQKGNFRKAIKEYYRIIDDQPDDVRILLKIGDLQARDGQRRAAVSTYGEVADYYVANGFFLKAVAVIKQLLKLDANNLEAKLRLADLYFQLGLISDATTQYNEVAATYLQTGETDQYLSTLQRIVDLDPNNVSNRIRVAEQFSKLGDGDSAAVHLGIACSQLYEAGRFEEYAKVAERYLHHRPSDLETVKLLSRTYIDLGNGRLALARIQPLFGSDTFDLESVRLLVDALVSVGEPARAAQAVYDLADMLEDQGRTRDAAQAREMAAAVDPVAAPPIDEEPILQFELVEPGDVPLPSPHQEEIERLLEEVDVYVKYHLHERTLAHLDLIFALDPNAIDAFERRWPVWVMLGEPDKAVADLVRIAALSAHRDPRRAELALDEADRQVAGHPDVANARRELGIGAVDAPAPPPTHVAPPRHTDEVEQVRRAAFDELDALFDGVTGAEAGHTGEDALDEDTTFIRDIETALDGGSDSYAAEGVVSLGTTDFLPADLDVALEEIDEQAAAGDTDGAHARLLELLGEWPEHAELITERMDALPSNRSDSDLGIVNTGMHAVVPEAAPFSFEIADPAPRTTIDTSDDDASFSLDVDFDDDGTPDIDDLFLDDAWDASPRTRPTSDGDVASGVVPLPGEDPNEITDTTSLFATSDHAALDAGAGVAPDGTEGASDDVGSDDSADAQPFASVPPPVASSTLASLDASGPQNVVSGGYEIIDDDVILDAALDAVDAPEPEDAASEPGDAAPAPPVDETYADDIDPTAFDDGPVTDTSLRQRLEASGDPDVITDDVLLDAESDDFLAPPTPGQDTDVSALFSGGAEEAFNGRASLSDFGFERDAADLDEASVEISLDDFDDDFEDTEVDGLDDLETGVGVARYEHDALATSGTHPAVDAPVGKASSAVHVQFGPSLDAMQTEPDGVLADAIRQRASGNGLAAIETFQDELFGDFPISAAFELAIANLELGLYFDALTALEKLLQAPDLEQGDRVLIKYYLGICHEALVQSQEALEHFDVVRRLDPERFPDVIVRIARL